MQRENRCFHEKEGLVTSFSFSALPATTGCAKSTAPYTTTCLFDSQCEPSSQEADRLCLSSHCPSATGGFQIEGTAVHSHSQALILAPRIAGVRADPFRGICAPLHNRNRVLNLSTFRSHGAASVIKTAPAYNGARKRTTVVNVFSFSCFLDVSRLCVTTATCFET